METIRGLVERRGRDDAARPFCRFGDGVLTFGDLDREVNRLANGLTRSGVGPGDRVAVMLPNHPDHLLTFLALAKLGATQVPINVHLKGLGLRHLLEHSEARVVVADSRYGPALLAALAGPNTVDSVVWRGTPVAAERTTAVGFADILAGGAPEPPRAIPPPDHVVSITYTSGTTGPPKGVMLGDKPYRIAGQVAGLLADVHPGDVMLVWEPLYHIGGSQVILTCLHHGVPMALVERFSASAFWAQTRRHGATQMHYLGGVLGLLLKQPPRADDADNPVRVAWGGGAPAHLWEPFERRFGVRIREAYGMTEAASFTTINLEGRVGSVGKPLPHFEVRIVEDDGAPCPARRMGEILVREREPGVLMRGYFKDPERTAEALRDGWLHTGDLGMVDEDGFLYFLGRRKDSLRRRGENVSAWEIERVVSMHDGVEECAVIGVPSEVGDDEIKLFVRPVAGKPHDPRALIRWCEERLADFQVPRYVEWVDDLPRTPTQRIRKEGLSRAVEGCWDRERSGYRRRREP